MSEKRTHIIRDITETIAITLIIFLVIRLAVESFRVDGESMEPNFHNNEYVFVDKAAYLFYPRSAEMSSSFTTRLDTHKDFHQAHHRRAGGYGTDDQHQCHCRWRYHLRAIYPVCLSTLIAIRGNWAQISSL